MENINTLLPRIQAMDWPELTALSARSGISYHTLAKIKRGETTNPRLETCQQIIDALNKRK
jgi:DNA-binding Xre family transcriptional regulator